MANAFYTKAKQLLFDGGLDWVNDTIRVYLVDQADYTPNLATDEFLSSIAGAGQVAFAEITPKTSVDGVVDGDDTVLSAVTGDQSEFLVIVRWTGSDATSNLLIFIDTAVGLPITPNGADENILWNASGIAAIT